MAWPASHPTPRAVFAARRFSADGGGGTRSPGRENSRRTVGAVRRSESWVISGIEVVFRASRSRVVPERDLGRRRGGIRPSAEHGNPRADALGNRRRNGQTYVS